MVLIFLIRARNHRGRLLKDLRRATTLRAEQRPAGHRT
jgi:hypothetical protein